MGSIVFSSTFIRFWRHRTAIYSLKFSFGSYFLVRHIAAFMDRWLFRIGNHTVFFHRYNNCKLDEWPNVLAWRWYSCIVCSSYVHVLLTVLLILAQLKFHSLPVYYPIILYSNLHRQFDKIWKWIHCLFSYSFIYGVLWLYDVQELPKLLWKSGSYRIKVRV